MEGGGSYSFVLFKQVVSFCIAVLTKVITSIALEGTHRTYSTVCPCCLSYQCCLTDCFHTVVTFAYMYVENIHAYMCEVCAFVVYCIMIQNTLTCTCNSRYIPQNINKA